MLSALDLQPDGRIETVAVTMYLLSFFAGEVLTTSRESLVYTHYSIVRARIVTGAETEPRSPESSIGGHLLLERVAAGDALAFGSLYDAFVADIYAICLNKCANSSSADKAMAKTWIFIWSHAAALNDQAGSTKFIVLSTAWTVTSQRGKNFPHLNTLETR
jgi:hypothetical protein